MLKHARQLAEDGRAVYVIADNMDDARRLQMQFGEPTIGVKFETARTLGNFDWERMRLVGAHPNCVVLIDHHAIEDRYAAMLQMLHMFDKQDAP